MEYRQIAGGLATGWCRRRESYERRGICDEKVVGFACLLADRAGPPPLFSDRKSVV